jgi:hypothetical protein
VGLSTALLLEIKGKLWMKTNYLVNSTCVCGL